MADRDGAETCPLLSLRHDGRFIDCLMTECAMWYDVETIKDGTVSTKERKQGCAILRALLRIGGIL
jgi:hypothetical protein